MKHLLKNKLLFLWALVFFYTSHAQESTDFIQFFTLQGEIKGLDFNLYFRHPDKEYKKGVPPDTIKVINGKVYLKAPISKLAYIRAYPSFNESGKRLLKVAKGGNGFIPVKSSYLSFYAFPGANVAVSGEVTDFMDAYPSGDKFNESLAAINKLIYPNLNTIGNLAVANTYETDSLQIESNDIKSDELIKTNAEILFKHIKENPKSLGATWYLNDMLLRRQIKEDQAIELFNNISTELSVYDDYKNIATRIEGIKLTAEGSQVPSIKTTATLTGNEFDINTLKGKVVLIDFWGIWCGPCVKEMPKVKMFYEKYKDKLVVLGINSGDSKEKIQEFVSEKGYEWQQLLSDKKNTPDNFVNRFNVQGFPTKFIIDRQGNIVKRFLGDGDEAFKLLEELLNQNNKS